ncbi:site-specific DNA-methyltransferase [Vannielia litorea]|uniref:site-specific DNA-methyltransferase n=1 Tax=Vannielia litorea TaxID=1217970 RepID=UPI001BCD26CD|nr:site-specific DNA-methyltransferase [Vannielia litorea]MBS8228418.1 DNA methyltransferase [Vannielia litorea]
MAEIAASITEFGFTNPILVNASGRIIAGHGRLAAAESLGLDRVPVVRLKHLSEAQERALVIADNRIAENASWDEERLTQEVAALQAEGFSLDLLGFEEKELEALLASVAENEPVVLPGDPEAVPDLEDDPVTQPGDLWVLGEHRLLCGDATSIEALERLMGGSLADAVWTDPPYNVNYQTAAGSIANDNLAAEEFQAFLRAAFDALFAAMKDGAAIYVAHADTEGLAFRSAFAGAGFKLSGCLAWVKPSLVLGRSDYQWRHEPILYGWKPGAAHSWFGGRAQTTVLEWEETPAVRALPDGTLQVDVGDQTLVVSGSDISLSMLEGSVVRVARPRRNDVHPTMKPTDLITRMLENSTRPGAVVLDPFGGSGSTIMACELTRRVGRSTELDPGYCDVIVRRWQEATGRLATLGECEGFEAVRATREAERAAA